MVHTRVKLKRIWTDIRRLTARGKIILGVILVVFLVAGFFVGSQFGRTPEQETVANAASRQVTLASVRELSQETDPLLIIGEVSSASEAAVRAESQGRLTQVLVQNGDRVTRGQVVMRIENSTQVAALRQAEAALLSQEAAVGRTQTLTGVSLSNAALQLEETRANTVNSLQAQYAQVREAVLAQADELFSNPLSTDPRLLFSIPTNQQQKSQLENQRLAVGRVLVQWGQATNELEPTQLTSSFFDEIESYVDAVNEFLSSLSAAASSLQATATLSESQIAGWKAAASAARVQAASIPGALNSLQSALAQAETSLALAEEEQNQSALGGSSTAEAGLRQAQSAVAAARVALEKTVVRAPISGVVSGLDLKVGDVVAPLQDVFMVSNNSALEIVTYVNEVERAALVLGGEAVVGRNRVPATITRIASVVDPETRKVEVVLSPVGQLDLIDGQSVSIRIERSGAEPDTMLVPLSALKVQPEGFAVFVLTADQEVQAQQVEVGPIVGQRVVIRAGLMMDDVIVTDVRGLAVGDRVQVADPLLDSRE
jgi:multidrug efflux pump subunit AcrA (membrane-fusion protein)